VLYARRTSKKIRNLERENLSLAIANKSAHKRISESVKRIDELDSDMLKMMEIVRGPEKQLTSEPPKTKIEPKPKRLTWSGTLAAIDREANKQEEA
jgi:hypothetical protein